MSSEARLAQLERKVHYLTDRQEIYDCLVRTSRGNDRFDEDLIVSSYHPDGLHELGQNFIPGPDYGAYANTSHTAICDVNMHAVTMHSCDIDGDVAHAESYVIGLFADKGALADARGALSRPIGKARWRMADRAAPDHRGSGHGRAGQAA